MSRPQGTIQKRPAESYPIGLRYWGADLPTGVTIASVTGSVAPLGLTLGGFSHSTTEAYVNVSGGTAGVDYVVTFQVSLTDGTIYVDDFLVKVRD